VRTRAGRGLRLRYAECLTLVCTYLFVDRAPTRSDTKEAVEHQSDLYLGTDGAFSAVRKNLMKNVR